MQQNHPTMIFPSLVYPFSDPGGPPCLGCCRSSLYWCFLLWAAVAPGNPGASPSLGSPLWHNRCSRGWHCLGSLFQGLGLSMGLPCPCSQHVQASGAPPALVLPLPGPPIPRFPSQPCWYWVIPTCLWADNAAPEPGRASPSTVGPCILRSLDSHAHPWAQSSVSPQRPLPRVPQGFPQLGLALSQAAPEPGCVARGAQGAQGLSANASPALSQPLPGPLSSARPRMALAQSSAWGAPVPSQWLQVWAAAPSSHSPQKISQETKPQTNHSHLSSYAFPGTPNPMGMPLDRDKRLLASRPFEHPPAAQPWHMAPSSAPLHSQGFGAGRLCRTPQALPPPSPCLPRGSPSARRLSLFPVLHSPGSQFLGPLGSPLGLREQPV